MASLIEDYAIIGDCHTAALVARDGSIDWMCLPRFDSGACFASLIGTPENGYWRIHPSHKVKRVTRRYRGESLILETEFETEGGAVRLIDFMPLRDGSPEVIRVVRGLRGRVSMRMDLTIRFDYGSIVPWVVAIERGISAAAGPDMVCCRSDVPMRGERLSTIAEFVVSRGDEVPFSFTWSPTHGSLPEESDWRKSLGETEKWWRDWVEGCTYHGEWRDAVVRSLITLKSLTYPPTGAMVAAPTTSLPERIGGKRNWDYRFCWIRDATFTVYALITGGYHAEACAWREWLVRAVAGTPSELQIMYGLGGERRLTELELGWLAGYENSRPVRIGNAAHRQYQLDVYGEVLGVIQFTRREGLPADPGTWRVETALLDFLESGWKKADDGIWEMRGPRRHFTHSKVAAWVAMDRAVKAVEDFGMDGDAQKWRGIAAQIRREVELRGFDSELNSFVQYYGSKEMDASLLLLPIVGFIDAQDPRMVGTVKCIEERLLEKGLIHRYRAQPRIDGVADAGDAPFLLCTFWYADNLVLQGRHREARKVMERLLALRNDVGLLPEEYDPKAKRFLGNFPQAFSHVGLINSARRLSAENPASVQKKTTGKGMPSSHVAKGHRRR
jgi:GH15 family glucan-1,4-alpha-glucosidase